MRVLVTGASGLIGATVAARLHAAGHQIVGVARHTRRVKRSMPFVEWHAGDMAALGRPEDWARYLAGIEAVVNCAGVLQDSAQDSTAGVHMTGADALFAACERAWIRRILQISAIGVDRAAPTAFSRSKRAGEDALMRRDLDWVILRPSVVLGAAAYGGSALFRGLAALPVLAAMPQTAPLQVVQLEDVAATVLFFVRRDAPSRLALDLAGPERLAMTDIVRAYRGWLGWREPRIVGLPGWFAALLYRLGDAAAWFGWRPPMRSTARYEIARGAIGDPARWTELTGIVPQSLGDALATRPASVQERWFAGLYCLKPVVFVVLALFWIATGVIALGPGYAAGLGLMQQTGAGALSMPAVVLGAIADIAVGIGIAWRRTTRLSLWSGLAVSAFYLLASTLGLPALWADPLGPLVKIFPIAVLHLVALAILEDR